MSEPRNVNIRKRHFSILIAVFNKKRRTKELTSNFEKNLAEILSMFNSHTCCTTDPKHCATCLHQYIYIYKYISDINNIQPVFVKVKQFIS